MRLEDSCSVPNRWDDAPAAPPLSRPARAETTPERHGAGSALERDQTRARAVAARVPERVGPGAEAEVGRRIAALGRVRDELVGWVARNRDDMQRFVGGAAYAREHRARLGCLVQVERDGTTLTID